jgi:hypothetical protein
MMPPRSAARRGAAAAARTAALSWALACCVGRAAAQCTNVVAPAGGRLPNATLGDATAGACDGSDLAAGDDCLVVCNDGYTCDADPCENECSATSVLTTRTCSPDDCTMERPAFGDWGTCASDSFAGSSLTRQHTIYGEGAQYTAGCPDDGEDPECECVIECAAGYIARPREAGLASHQGRQTCTAGTLSFTGCELPELCVLMPGSHLPANASWGTCTTVHPDQTTYPGGRQLSHGETCKVACDKDFNASTAVGSQEISCDDGTVTNTMACEYTYPPEPEPEPTTWEDEGHWVIYDTEGTEVLECTSADGDEYLFTVPATGEGCPDSDDTPQQDMQRYVEQYEGDRSGDPCVWDPFFSVEYPAAAGVNLTLRWAYEDVEAIYPTREEFQQAFEYEMVRPCPCSAPLVCRTRIRFMCFRNCSH